MRAYGVGRIFLRGTTYWCAYCLRGKEHRESTGHTDEQKARAFLRNRLKEVHADEIGAATFITPAQRRLTVSDLIDSLRNDYALRGQVSPQRKSELARAESDFGDNLAVALSADSIDRYIKRRVDEGTRPATINRITQILGHAYKLAIERGDLHSAPRIRHLSETGNARKGFFSRDQFEAVAGHLENDLADFCLFAYLTGWRKGEIASLEWSDIEDDVIRLRAENSKNREPRSVVIADDLAALIERRRQVRLIKDVLCSLVFHRGGAPIGDFRKAWASACVAAGVGKMVCPNCGNEGAARKCGDCGVATKHFGRIFHDFRRTAVRDMVRSGVPQSVAMKISGHKTDSMFRRYDIANEDDLRQAMESLGRYRKAAAAKVVPLQPQKAARKIRTKFGQSAEKAQLGKVVNASKAL